MIGRWCWVSVFSDLFDELVLLASVELRFAYMFYLYVFKL